MIADAIDQAGAMAAFLTLAVFVVTVSLTLLALFATIGLMRLWRRLTVGSWNAAIRVTERKAFE
jgi:hypothetical protein